MPSRIVQPAVDSPAPHAEGSRIGKGAAFATGAAAALLTGHASAATIVVNSLADNVTGGNGQCTLREALANANSNSDTTGGDCVAGSGVDTIDLSGLSGTITLGGTQLTISDSATLQGPGAGMLTIDANNVSRVFYIYNNASTLAVTISGVTLTKGRIGAGRGSVISNKGESLTLSNVTVNNSRPTGGIVSAIATGSLTIQNSTISGNTGGSGAGGIYVVGGASLSISNSTISGNTSSRGAGLMVKNSTSPVTITNTNITGNTATSGKGGGIFLYTIGSAVSISGSTVTGNTTANRGGGISLYKLNAALTISDTTISGNTSTGHHGGGFTLYKSSAPGTVTFQRSTISGNQTTGGNDGGGLFLYKSGSVITLENTTVSGNAAENGGGIDILNPAGGNSLVIRSSTIAFNTAASLGGNINGGNNANNINVINSIIAGGAAATGPDIRSGSATITLNYSLLQSTSGATIGGANNLTGVNPLLVALANNGGPTQTHLIQGTSPAVDAGSTTFVTLPATDQRGSARVTGASVDMGAVELDFTPNAFTFTAQTGVIAGAAATSNSITVSGIDAGTPISVSGGTYSINGGPFVSTTGTVNNGDTVVAGVTASSAPGGVASATTTIGGVSAAFSVTTLDQTPNAFSFVAQTGVAAGAVSTSNMIAVSGTDAGTPISIVGGTYSINSGPFVSVAGTVNNGDTVAVRLSASATAGGMVSATLTIGTVSAAFNVTTLDQTPNAFSFVPQTHATAGGVSTSNIITVSGIDPGTPISIVGGTYSINGGPFVSTAGTVNNGDTVAVRVTASTASGGVVSATLTIGSASAAFSVTTLDSTPNAFSFAPQTGAIGGAISTSNTITVSGIDPGIPIGIVGGTYSINGGAFVASAGTVNNGDTVAVRVTASTASGAVVSATLTIGSVSAAFDVTTGAAALVAVPTLSQWALALLSGLMVVLGLRKRQSSRQT